MKSKRAPGRDVLWGGFFIGSTFILACWGLFQDFMGKEGYIEHVREHWVSSSISVPIFIVGLLAATVYMIVLLKMSRNLVRREDP